MVNSGSETPPPVRKPGPAVAVIVLLMLAASVFAWTGGNDWFEATFPVSPLYEHGARAALVVCALSAVAALAAIWNTVLLLLGRRPLNVSLPRRVDTYLQTGFAIAVGLLIGTTVFR